MQYRRDNRKRTELLAASLLCALILAAPARSQQKDGASDGSTLQSVYDTALKSQKSRNLPQAAAEFRSFAAEAQGELATEYAAAGDFPRAVELFKASLLLQPDSPVVRLGYARTALLMGNPALAQSLAQQFLNDNLGGFEQIAQAHQILGRALLKMNQEQQARSELEQAVALDPVFSNRYDLAVVCLDQDDGKCAEADFQALEKSYGDKPAVHMQIGLAYGNSDFAPRAVDEFKKVIAEDPHYPEARYALAAALLASGGSPATLGEAETELKTELTISPRDFLTYAALGKLAVEGHRYVEAETYLHRAIALNPGNPDAYLYLGQMCLETGHPADAETALRKSIALSTDPSRNRYQVQKSYYLLGRALMQQNKPDEAHAAMKLSRSYENRSLSHDVNQLSGSLNNTATTSLPQPSHDSVTSSSATTGAVDAAAVTQITAFQKQLTPAIASSYNSLGVIAALSRDYAAAASSFAAAARWNPALEGVDLNWGHAAFSASQFAEAIAPLTRYIQSHPQDSSIRGALGMSQYMTGDYRGCIATLGPVKDTLDSIPQIAFVYADSLAHTGRESEAIPRLLALEKQHPNIPEVHRALSQAYKSTNQSQKSLAELQQYNQLAAKPN